MEIVKLTRLKRQLDTLRSIEEEYSGRTIGNVIQQIESRIKHAEK